MPQITYRTFEVRHYECDAYGHLNNAIYLKYMQEAAFKATAEAGYSYDWLVEHNRAWLAWETRIEYLKPVSYGESVKVKTWVADFRKVRSVRRYEMTLNGTDEVVARGQTDWVHIDLETQRPIAIPDEMYPAFLPDGPDPDAPPRAKFPKTPDLPPRPYVMRRTVEWRDIDTMWHVNNSNYFSYMEEGGVQAPAYFGWPMDRLKEEYNIGAWMYSYHILYENPALFHDEIELTTFVSDLKRASGIRHFIITRPADGLKVCRARLRFAFVDLESGRPKKLPGEVLKDFEGHMT